MDLLPFMIIGAAIGCVLGLAIGAAITKERVLSLATDAELSHYLLLARISRRVQNEVEKEIKSIGTKEG